WPTTHLIPTHSSHDVSLPFAAMQNHIQEHLKGPLVTTTAIMGLPMTTLSFIAKKSTTEKKLSIQQQSLASPYKKIYSSATTSKNSSPHLFPSSCLASRLYGAMERQAFTPLQ